MSAGLTGILSSRVGEQDFCILFSTRDIRLKSRVHHVYMKLNLLSSLGKQVVINNEQEIDYLSIPVGAKDFWLIEQFWEARKSTKFSINSLDYDDYN